MMPRPRTALIFGITGQDGAYLAHHLIARNIEVHGTSRDREGTSLSNLRRLGICDQVTLHSANLNDFRSVARTIQTVQPAHIYNLAAQASVGLSFELPVETIDSVMHGTINIMEAIRFIGLEARFYHAASSECFGNTSEGPADETTPFRPRSPYAVAKAAAFWAVANYREAYKLFACSGILFNHESPLRPARYVTQKIVRGAADIAEGKAAQLSLGRLDISRDWGWAPEYADAMTRMLSQDTPDDFVIATGTTTTLQDFVAAAFAAFGLDWTQHVEIDQRLFRPADIVVSRGNAAKAARVLKWTPTVKMPALVNRLVEGELARRRTERS
jgi:GDPmannose 4,6-dehydratase